MGSNKVAPLKRAVHRPRPIDVDNPNERFELLTKQTGCPRNSTRMRRARGTVTTTIFCTANGASTAIVLRIKLTPRIVAKAFDRPIRVEKPAANTTMRSLESLVFPTGVPVNRAMLIRPSVASERGARG
ncbi:MAG: hypothetical protein WBF89_16635 [Steroidobacteraceae bacterium]